MAFYFISNNLTLSCQVWSANSVTIILKSIILSTYRFLVKKKKSKFEYYINLVMAPKPIIIVDEGI